MAWDERDEEGQGSSSFSYTFTCVTSKAGFNEYNEGKTALLILEGEAEFTNGNIIDKHLWLSTPRTPADAEGGWSATDDGFFFFHTADPDQRFGRNSKIQKFISSALQAGVPLKEKGDNALDARAWAGSKFRIEEKEVAFERDGEKTSYTQPLVVEYLGEVSVGPAAVTPKAKGKAAPAANGAGTDLTAKAGAIAKQYAENEDFIAYITAASTELNVPLDHEVCSKAFFDAAIKA